MLFKFLVIFLLLFLNQVPTLLLRLKPKKIIFHKVYELGFLRDAPYSARVCRTLARNVLYAYEVSWADMLKNLFVNFFLCAATEVLSLFFHCKRVLEDFIDYWFFIYFTFFLENSFWNFKFTFFNNKNSISNLPLFVKYTIFNTCFQLFQANGKLCQKVSRKFCEYRNLSHEVNLLSNPFSFNLS